MGYIFDIKQIPEVVHQLKKEGLSVVLTHGTYDLFHPGHLSFLKKSRRLGDVQIVGVDDDDLVKRLKGINRPIIPVMGRARILASLNLVDFVFLIKNKPIMNDDYYIDFYRRTMPDYVTYGKSFGFVKQFQKKKNMIKKVKYQELDSRVMGDPPPLTTTQVIELIRERA